MTGARTAWEIHLRGVVQGVGYRPFVHRLAVRHGFDGMVRNEAGEVRIEIEGPRGSFEAFRRALVEEAPPLARIDALEAHEIVPGGRAGFRVEASDTTPGGRLPVSPDVATCAACERELRDPGDRRFRYPFITCTDCGPRYTVIESMPYDRERTSMRTFTQCAACLAEYGDPADRRYHSETNSCPACGPNVWFCSPAGERIDGDRAIAVAARALRRGKIVAIRGLGGFHLAVDAGDERAVARLRRRKARETKPLAVMAASRAEAREIGEVGEAEEALLGSAERPVVLLSRRPTARLAPSIAPGLDTVGVMTPYTPLHHVLLEAVGRPLVMTSGNLSDEPIAIGIEEARERLAGVADAFLLHDREIVSRYDDSVVRVVDGAPVFLRRSRGYAPLPLDLPVATPVPLLAVGPHLKNTFTLADGSAAFVSQHVGDLENLETLEHFEDALARYRALFRIEPEAVVRDLHPGYLSTRIAEETGLPSIAVQHHHAHVAAVAAEHGVAEPVVGIAYDGTGYGEDGYTWGAEVMVADLRGFRRIGHLRYAPLPGGDLAVRRPWRVALGYASVGDALGPHLRRALEGVEDEEVALAWTQVERGLHAPLASSMGRLFDAAAAVLGIRRVARYEAQAAMELEALAGDRPAEPLPFPVSDAADGSWILEPVPLLAALGERCAAGDPVADLAARFHESVARATVGLALAACETEACSTVVLGGGCFQNARLLSSVRRGIEAEGVRLLVPRDLGPGDGAISYGQAAVAAARLADEEV